MLRLRFVLCDYDLVRGSIFILFKSLKGNPDVHIILRGGTKGPNYAAEFVKDSGEKLVKAGLAGKIMVSPFVFYSVEY